MAGKAKQVYWAVRSALTRTPRDELVAEWEQKTAGRELPPDHFETAVYFADSVVNLYQLRQWYDPLKAWNEHSPCVLLCRSINAALALLPESPIPVVYVPRVDDVEQFVSEQRLRMALYVNQNTRNFQMMRTNTMLHVFISHGESDKSYMISGQMKAYDFAFIAGQAAANRLSKALLNYDVDKRAKRIGRPQLDFQAHEVPDLPDDDRIVVFYAPTWEGDRGSMTYGSVQSHGIAMVQALVNSGRHRIIVRPHPRTGVASDEQGAAVERIAGIVARANAADPGAQHVFDQTPTFDWQLEVSDIAITDVSAAVNDWLATGKPLVVTAPAGQATLPDEGYLATLDMLPADRAGDIVAVLDDVIADDAGARERMRWVEYYFGDTTPGVATQKWLEACRDVVDTCKRQLAALGPQPPHDVTGARQETTYDVLQESESDS